MSEEKREYLRKWRQKRKREKGGWLTKVYGNMRTRNRLNYEVEINFTKTEFEDWLDTNYLTKFDELFKRYVDSDCDKDLVPSIDRLDDYKPYTLDNIRLTTWTVNNEKGRSSRKTREHCGEMAKRVWSRETAQCDLEGNLLAVFPSTREAERRLGFVDHNTIAKVCRGEKHTHKGFIWRYTEEERDI